MLSSALIAGGSLLGSAVSAYGQHSANSENREMAREQMAFQERMSSSAYQRATADMNNAGINPMMAYSMGGASTPSGASSSSGNAYNNTASDFAHSSRAVALETKAVESSIDKNRSEIGLNEASAAREKTAALLNVANTNLSNTSAKHSVASLSKVQNEAAVHDSWFGKYLLAPANTVGSAVGNLFGGANSAKSAVKRHGPGLFTRKVGKK